MKRHKLNVSGGDKTKCGIIIRFRKNGRFIWKHWIREHLHWHWTTCKNCKKTKPKDYKSPAQLERLSK